MKKHIDASILFIYFYFSICFLSTVFYSFVYNSIPVFKFKLRSVDSGIIIQTFPIHRRLHCNYKLSIIPEEVNSFFTSYFSELVVFWTSTPVYCSIVAMQREEHLVPVSTNFTGTRITTRNSSATL